MQISLEKYEEMQDRIGELEKENEELRKTPHWWHWISVKGRLPEDDGEVLACYRSMAHYYVFIANHDERGWFKWCEHDDGCLYRSHVRVSHWMPLPEPPEVEDGNGE